MKIDYSVVLKQLQHELDGIDDRRKALLASIAAISRLIEPDEESHGFGTASPTFRTADPSVSDVRLPAIPPGFFVGKSPTEAYRALMQRWPGYYSPPQLADLFVNGGMTATTRTALIQAIHTVLRRERNREDRNQGAHGANGTRGG